jgi:hypothetical protein
MLRAAGAGAVAQADLSLSEADVWPPDLDRGTSQRSAPRQADCPGESWAVDALRQDDTTVSAIARHLGVAWDTCWSAIKVAAKTRLAEPGRLKGIRTIGVDEHIWRPSKISSTDKAFTVMVDLTRDEHGYLHARLLDAVQGPVREGLRRLADRA